MKSRLALVGAVASWGLTTAALVLLGATTAAGVEENLFHYQDAAVGTIYPALGWLLIRRLGSHPVGWILLASGLSGALGAFCEVYVTVGFEVHPGALPAVAAVAWIGAWTWVLFFALLPSLLLVFPDGKPPSPRWWPVVWLARIPVVALPAVLAVATWGVPLPSLAASTEPEFPAVLEVMFGALVVALVVALVAAVVSLGVRWQRSTGTARQQMKVFFLFAAVGVVALGLSQGQVGYDVLGVLAFILVPVGMVAAILRYRLYDIDRLVSRTVSYALVTAAVLAVFFVSIFLLQLVLPAQNDLATAASTLAAAAAFNPLRRRVQDLVDRRFNRGRYDAEQTAEEFVHRLRSGQGRDVRTSLEDVIARTLEPAHLSVWLPGLKGSK